MTLTEKIINYCTDHSIDVREFERMCKISPRTIYRWQCGFSCPNLKTLKRIEKGTGISIVSWLSDTDWIDAK